MKINKQKADAIRELYESGTSIETLQIVTGMSAATLKTLTEEVGEDSERLPNSLKTEWNKTRMEILSLLHC